MAMEDNGGIRRVTGGRSIVEEAKTGQNTTVAWVGPAGAVSLTDQKVIDALEFDWRYQLGSVVWTLAEEYQNSGESQYIDLIATKYDVLEDSMMNQFHAGMLSNGTGDGGLQLQGLAALVSTTPSTGTIGTVDRSNANALWARNQKFDTSVDWASGVVSASNVKRFLDQGINATIQNSKTQAQLGLLGTTHWNFLNETFQAVQSIQNESGTGRLGFEKLIYRGVPMYYGGGINYSGATTQTATRSYLLNVKPGGVNLIFHKKAEFDLLEPNQSEDQAARSRLMFTMAAMTIGGHARLNWVGFD
jgi:hypothetical protein